MLHSLETNIMHRYRSELKSIMGLPLPSIGNPYLSAFGERWSTEGLVGGYVDAPFLESTDPRQL